MFQLFKFSRVIKQSLHRSTWRHRPYSLLTEDVPNTHAWSFSKEDGEISCLGSYTEGSGIILGVYTGGDQVGSNALCLTKTATVFNENSKGRLITALKATPIPKVGEVRTFPNLDPNFDIVVVVGVGDNDAGYNKVESRDEAKENIRKAVGAGVRHLQDLKMNKIYVEGFDDPESAAEGAHLAIWENHHLRPVPRRVVKIPDLVLYGDCNMKNWRVGLEKAEAQNFARKLMETPANLMTPRALAYTVVQALCKTSVNVTLRGERWLRDNNMHGFLENTRGSPQSPILVELAYNGCDPSIPPVSLIGKGLTFNSGGLCLKTCEEIKHMRGDMAGAASIIATFKALSTLGLPINVMGFLALGENMPGGSAGKARDIVKTLSGKSILVAPKDFNGNLMLADTVCHAQRYKPKYIVSVATLTKEMGNAFHLSTSGLFTKNEKLWQLLKTSAIHSGDRLWKCPVWNMHGREVTDFCCCDVSTFQDLKYFPRGISSLSAAFLNEFSCHNNWAHVDIAGVMYEDGTTPYLKKGMSGRPTRTMIEFLGQLAYPPLEGVNIPEDTAS